MTEIQVKRIKKVYQHFKENGETQDTFASRLGLTQAHFSRVLRGLSPILPQHTLLLEHVYNINKDWLDKGKGDMFHDVTLEKPDRKLKAIAKNYSSLDENKREELLDYSKALLKDKKPVLGKVADKSKSYGKKKS